MSITIDEIIRSVFQAIKRQGISLPQSKRLLVEKEANKLIKDLIEIKNKEEKIHARFLVTIPCSINQASIRNRTVRKFIKTIKPSVEMEFELSKKALTLCDSYDIFEGEIRTFPCHMRVDKKDNKYFFNYEES